MTSKCLIYDPNYTYKDDDGDIDMDGQTLDMNTGEVTGAVSVSAQTFLADNGSATNPSISFTNDTNTGIYLAGPDSMLLQAGEVPQNY